MLKNLLSHAAELVLNEAVHEELYASNLYKHLANQCQRLGLFGAAKYFASESAEELTHYQVHVDYFNDRGGVAVIPPLEAFEFKVSDLKDSLETAYKAEVDLGNKYASWYSQLLSTDPMTARHLLQFLEIQQKSIGEYGDWLSRLELVNGNEAGMILIDQELGA